MDRDRERRPYDRERERDRDRDRDRERLGGESYRPRRSPPRDGYGNRGGPPSADTYVPRGPRARSRSPGFRRRSRSPPPRESNWRERERPRSPPRRFSPPRRDDDRRDTRFRSPVRDGRFNRSPRRERSRSPYGKRGRDFSPARSPPPKRERVASPPRNRFPSRSPPRRAYSPRGDRNRDERRDRSPRRDDRYKADSRRRSPEPHTYASNSATTSRQTSPPVHPSRARLVPEINTTRSPAYGSPMRSPRTRESPARDIERDQKEYKNNNGTAKETSPYRNGDAPARVPPSGPKSSLSINAIAPPSGPAASSAGSAHNRYGNPVLSAPSRPRGRGGPSFGGYPPRDFSGPPPRRGREFSGPPSRGAYGPGPSPRGGHFPGGFRGSGNSTSSTYPRTQRFDTPSTHLSDLPSIIQGGQKAPPRDAVADAKIKKLEEEAERLRLQIADKQKAKRVNLREWDKMSADTQSAKIRADFAEENLAKVVGEDTNGPAF